MISIEEVEYEAFGDTYTRVLAYQLGQRNPKRWIGGGGGGVWADSKGPGEA